MPATPDARSEPPAPPPGAPSSWVVRSPEPADAQAAFDLVAACDEAVLGYPDVALADVEADLAGAPERQLLVVDGDRVIAWVWLEDRAAGRTYSDVYVDPRLSADDPDLADRVAEWGWTHALAQAADIARQRGVDETGLEVGVLDGDDVSRRRAEAAGFAPVRTFWRMHRPLTPDDATAPDPAPGVTVRRVSDDESRTAYEIVESAFADHWNHHPRTYDEWWGQHSGVGFDPDLWWFAELDGRPVGVLIANRQMADEDAMYIAIVGTLREARGRGVATTLLHKAFAAGFAEGWSRARLNVDSGSATSAPSLYAGVGMTVEFAMHAWQRPVAAEPEPEPEPAPASEPAMDQGT